ncbi:MAG: hypothetical protein JNM55_03615 [Anaerolineales bacterium]|nr:hypothetical protein [Anaerolineales bacterium]
METLRQSLICGGIIGYFVFIARFFFLAARAHSDLVRFEYENLPDQWEKDGEPQGMLFWKAPTKPKKLANRLFLSNPGITSLLWDFKTPKWVNNYPEAQKHLRAKRLNILWWILGILSPLILFFSSVYLVVLFEQ